MRSQWPSFPVFAVLVACSGPTAVPLTETTPQEGISGNPEYIKTPFVSAGDRVYMVGHQDGSFPDLGWHVTGEMGGIWDHPIKLLDGFDASVNVKGQTHCLDDAIRFENYPVGNRHFFHYADAGIDVERFQYVPDSVEGVVVEYRLFNTGADKKSIEFSFAPRFDLSPTWLGERTGMVDGEDSVDVDPSTGTWLAKDANNTWFALVGADRDGTPARGEPSCNKPAKHVLNYSLDVAAGDSKIITFFIAGSAESEQAMRSTFNLMKTRSRELLAAKVARYTTIDRRAELDIPDTAVAHMYDWLKYNVDWLIRTVPGEGTGLSAGLPDYPWWFGADATYALQGVLATGDHALARETILLLHRISKRTNNNGRIIHEVSTNGAVYNAGNVNETAQFITLLYNYYAWTGDRFTVQQIMPDVKQGIEWLLGEKDPDGDGFPNGSGMMEIPGLESDLAMIDVAVYTQQALASAAHLARAVNDTTLEKQYRDRAARLAVRINQDWWSATEKSFGDFRATRHHAKDVFDAAIIRSDTLQKEQAARLLTTKRARLSMMDNNTMPFVVYSNWVVNTPMETGVADRQKAGEAFRTAAQYENAFGVFVTGIDKTDEPDSVVLKSRKKTFSYTGAVMTLPTGVLSVGTARYGMPDVSLRYIKKLQQSFSYAFPGSMYEVSPDFGMITQAWNIYGVAVPIIHYMFGIQPEAYAQAVHVNPNIPTAWPTASIRNVVVGANNVSVSIERTGSGQRWTIVQSKPDWTIRLNEGTPVTRVVVDGKEIERETLANAWSLHGAEIIVDVSERSAIPD